MAQADAPPPRPTSLLPLAVLAVSVGYALKEIDYKALGVYARDRFVGPEVLTEPEGCIRLTGPIGAEDAVVLDGAPPIIIAGELDAGVHEFTNLNEHGTSASTSPRGALWTLDRLSDPTPRLTRLEVPLPEGVTTMHTHGLGLHGNVLFAINHAFRGGGERIERWLVTRTDGGDADAPPVKLKHVGSVTGHGGDARGVGAWTFTSRLNAAINDIAPIGPHEWFMTQFLDAPASLEGGGSGELFGYEAEPESAPAAALRSVGDRLGVPIQAKTVLRRLRRSRVWHCYCAAGAEVEADIDSDEPLGSTCHRTACEPIGPNSTCWNGITYKRLNASAAAAINDEEGARPPHGLLFVNDIFRRVVTEFAVRGSGAGARLSERRTFQAPYLVDNVHVDATDGESLWVGAVGVSHNSMFNGLAALRAKAAAAFISSSDDVPRPHTHLRPSADAPPDPAMGAGALRIDLRTGTVSTQLLQYAQLASISWSHGIGGKLFMGSPWDDGILVCPAA